MSTISMEHEVFISYSHKEKNVADGVCHYLEENGIKCWIAPRDIPAGSDYGDLIEEAIKTSSVVVLVYSTNSFGSKWVKGEINVAFEENKPILPFRIDEMFVKGAFRVMLKSKHWIDAYPSYADRLPELLHSVRGFIDPSVAALLSDELGDLEYVDSFHEAELRIETDTDCYVYHEDSFPIYKRDSNVIRLPKGRHKFRFVHPYFHELFDEREIEITDSSGMDLIEVNLSQKEDEYYSAQGYTIIGTGKTTLTEEDVNELGNEKKLVKVANTVVDINNQTFKKCKKLQSVIVPDSVSNIGQNAFEGLKSVTYHGKAQGSPWGALSVNGFIQDGFIYPDNKKDEILGYIGDAQNVCIPDSVTVIGNNAFEDCRDIVSIEIPRSVRKIKECAFKNCKNLMSVIIPDTISTIEKGTFEGCIKLTSVKIPDSITSIESRAYYGCKRILSIVLPESVDTIGREAFANCSNLHTVKMMNPYTEYYVAPHKESFWGNVRQTLGELFLGGNTFPDNTEIIKG